MARRKVRLADNIARFIFIEDDATQGATLGVNLYDSNGNVLTVEGLRALLDLETSTTVVNTAPGGTTDHGTLAGLADNDHPQYSLTAHNHDHGALTGLGDDDHPQYGALAQNEAVAGSWSFTYGDTDFSGADHASLWLGDLGAALNEKWFGVSSTAGEFHVGTTADVGGSEKDIFRATRIGTAIDSVAYGNSTDLPIHQFWGEVALQTDGWISLDEHASAPATPATGRVAVYAKADGKVYRKDDTGTETELGGGGGSSYLDDLLDVDAALPLDGQVLTWDDYYSEWVPATSPAGVTDHGLLSGLTDNDHPQYVKRHGFVVDSATWEVDMSYDAGTRKVTVTPTGATFDIWVGGVKYTKTGAQVSDAHDTTSGGYFLTYDSAGALQWSATPWDIDDDTEIPVAYVYWNNEISDGAAWFEAHTFERSLVLHKNLHFTQGTKAESSGFALADYTLATDSDAAVTPSVASGKVYDEDIVRTAAAVVNGGPYTIWWRQGTAGLWRWSTTDSFPFKAGTYPQRNYDAGGLTGWTLADISGTGLGQWVNVWVFTTTGLDSQNQTFFVVGQNVYTSLAAAQGESLSNISWGTIPFQEVAPLYKITLQAKSTFGGTYKAEIVAVERQLGGGASVISALTPTTHNSLSGRSDADVHPASSVTVTPAGGIAATTVQAALEELDSEKGGIADAETVSGKWDFTYDPVSGYGSQFSGYAQFANGFECKDYIEFVADAGGTDYLSWYWGNYDGAADEKWWILESDASKKEWAIRSCNDTFSGASYRDHLKLHRNGQVVDAITLGDTADDPSITLNTAALSGATGGYEFLSVDSDGATGVSGTYIELNSDVHSEFLLKSFVNDTYGPTMTFYHSRGTKASPTQSLSGDSTGGFFFGARHNSGDYQYPAGVEFTLSGNSDSVTGAPGALIFKTGLTALALVPRISIKTDGEVALGTDGWITFDEHTSAPATPASGRVALYAKADGKVYCKDDAGTETDLTAGGAGGSVATDTIWDAKGDLAVGTGANTASKLTVGADYLTLVSDAAEATGAKWGSIGIPQNAQTGNYTIALTDNGKHIFHASGDGAGDVYTIPANASVALPVGFAVTFINMATDTVSIAITTDTMYFSPTGATGSRTLSQYGIATAVKVTSTTWVISGSGLA